MIAHRYLIRAEVFMHPADIKAEIEKAGLTQMDLARSTRVSHPTIHLVIYGKSRSKKVETAIAKVIGKPLTAIWPKWYATAKDQVAA